MALERFVREYRDEEPCHIHVILWKNNDSTFRIEFNCDHLNDEQSRNVFDFLVKSFVSSAPEMLRIRLNNHKEDM